jgi:hypothetical protein
MATLAEIRAKLQASSQQNSGGSAGGDNAIYPIGISQKVKQQRFVSFLMLIKTIHSSGLNVQ